MALMHYKGFK